MVVQCRLAPPLGCVYLAWSLWCGANVLDNWRYCRSLDIASSIPTWSTTIFLFLCGLLKQNRQQQQKYYVSKNEWEPVISLFYSGHILQVTLLWLPLINFLEETQKRCPIAHPWGWVMGCLLWGQSLNNAYTCIDGLVQDYSVSSVLAMEVPVSKAIIGAGNGLSPVLCQAIICTKAYC